MTEKLSSKVPRVVTCAVCGGLANVVSLEITEPDRFERAVGIVAQGYMRRWLECSGCGAASNSQSTDHRERLAQIAGSYYEIDFGQTSLRTRYNRVMNLPKGQSDNDGRVSRVSAMIDAWLQRFEGVKQIKIEQRRALDIGAGLGVFLSSFSRSGWQADAIEPDPKACLHLADISEGRFRVFQDMFTGQPQFSGYDLVTLNKVIEHIPDPVDCLRKVSHTLHPERGLAYVEVPDKLTVSSRASNDNILGALHHHLYDPRSLAALFKASQLEPVQIARVFEPSGKITVYGFATTTTALKLLASNPHS